MKALLALPLIFSLAGCNYLEARSTLRDARSNDFPSSEQDVLNASLDGSQHIYQKQMIADRFIQNPGASFTNWYRINELYDLVIRTDSTTSYLVMSADDVWIERN